MVEVRRLVVGVLSAAAVLAGLLVAAVVAGLSAAPAGATTPSASALYKDALATTHGWSVHYDSSSTQTNVTLVASGDAGPAGASQTVTVGQGSINILVIGGLSYVKGNAEGLQSLAGLSAAQANEAAGQWIEFSTDNAAFASVVEGVRSSDVAKELALKGPISLGRTRTLRGVGGRPRGDPGLRQEDHPRRPLRARQGNARSGGGRLSELTGKADRRRARRLLQMGGTGAAEGADRDDLGGVDKRGVRNPRKQPDDRGRPRGRGKISSNRPWPVGGAHRARHGAGPPGE